MKENKWKSVQKKKKKRNEMRNINLFRSYYIISHVHVVFFIQLKMSKFRVRFDTMLLCEMCLSISEWMPTKICLYTYYYIPFLNDQSFHQTKLCKSNWRAKSVSTSNMPQSSSCSSNYMCYLLLFDLERSNDFYKGALDWQ